MKTRIWYFTVFQGFRVGTGGLPVTVDVPKDRNGTFEPQVVKNRQKDISSIDDIIIGMYARGLTTRQISDQIEDIYGFECTESFISNVTDKILTEIEDWQTDTLIHSHFYWVFCVFNHTFIKNSL